MTEPPEAVRHHPVPEWHIRMFGHGTESRKVHYYDKQQNKVAEAGAAKFIRLRYYTVDNSLRGRPDELETLLAGIENRAAVVARKLRAQISGSRFSIDEVERVELAEYLASLHVRVPSARNTFLQKSNDYVVGETMRELSDAQAWLADARNRGLVGTNEELQERRVQTLEAVEAGALGSLPERFSLASFSSIPTLTRLILGHAWQLVRRRKLPLFVLGDNPVSHCEPEGPGTNYPFIQVPLSPWMMLVVMDDGGRGLDGRILSADDITGQSEARARTVLPPADMWQADQAARCNFVSWITAERYVWGATLSDLMAIHDRISPESRNVRGSSGLQLRILEPGSPGATGQ